jgi:hypothetical protein
MDAGRFDRLAAAAGSETMSRRAVLGGIVGGAFGLLVGADAPARGKAGKKRCKGNQTRCNGACVNTDTDRKHCGRCGLECAKGEQCLNGRCYGDDTCPFEKNACPDFKRCGGMDSDCFCGTTGGGATVCFQDENFCENPRPCQTTNDCSGGRVCIDSSDCCADYNLPDVPRTCVLPCENRAAKNAKSLNVERKAMSGGRGPGVGA